MKARLIATYGSSSESRLRKLIKGQVSTCGKPSLVLTRLRALDSGCSEQVLRTVFLDQLPASCRAVLIVSEIADLNKLAVMADKFVEASEPGANSVTAVAATAPARGQNQAKCVASSSTDAKLDKLIKQFQALSNKVNKISRARSLSRRRSSNKRGDEADSSDKQSGYCSIHRKYGTKATFCKKPCSWKDEISSEN